MSKSSAYRFPVPMFRSCELAARGAYVKRAALYSGTIALSIFKPTYDYEITQEKIDEGNAPQVELRFYDGPVHFGLMEKWDVSIVIEVYGNKPPYFMAAEGDVSLMWDAPQEKCAHAVVTEPYKSTVSVSSDTGPKVMNMIYFRGRGGYTAD